MARIRTIKPDFWTDEKLAECSLAARLLFIGMLNFADDNGNLTRSAKKLKMQVFPADNIDCEPILQELIFQGIVFEYAVGNDNYLSIKGFLKHQVINKPSSSSIPKPLDNNQYDTTTGILPESYSTERKGMERKGKEEYNEANASVGSNQKPQCPADELVRLYHELMPLNPAVKGLNDARRKTIRARWKEAGLLTCRPFGYSNREDGLKAWHSFFEVCAESEFLTGRVAPQPGKPPFLADIDFLMSPSGFAKCLENKYHRESA